VLFVSCFLCVLCDCAFCDYGRDCDRDCGEHCPTRGCVTVCFAGWLEGEICWAGARSSWEGWVMLWCCGGAKVGRQMGW
jgi:hypothetical protein